MPMGNGMQEGNVLGPIQNKMQFDKVNELVEDAKANGATIIRGGKPMDGAGYFYPITLLSTKVLENRTFGWPLPTQWSERVSFLDHFWLLLHGLSHFRGYRRCGWRLLFL